MKIPLIKPDLPRLDEIREPLEEILSNGRITNFGKYVRQFEAEAGDYLGAHAVSVSSGTMALLYSLSALGLKAGEKVVFPSFTFMATGQAVLYAGGIPVFAEVEDDLNLSPSDLEMLLDQHDDIGAVIAVHMYGLPARIKEIEDVVARASRRRGRKIPLIFDAAHAFGAAVDGVRVGGFGDAEVFSLSVTKVLVTVEGGLIATRDPDLAARLRPMRNYGIQSNYNARYPGMNGKMSEFHAIVGLHNLGRLDALMAERQEKAECYKERVHGATRFRLTSWPQGVVHTFKDFTVVGEPGMSQADRDRVIAFLAKRDIETRAYFYPPVHEQELFSSYADRPLPRTEDLSRRVITLPFYTSMTHDEMDWVVSALADAEREHLNP